MQDPVTSINNRRIALDHLRDMLLASEENILGIKKRQHVKLAASLDALSPLKVLSRGYAIVSDSENNTVKSVKALSVGDKLQLKFGDGNADCVVESLDN